ncbi:MAG: helix-turn-helix domain-containing protein [Candidatus Aenigmarchaeota archaeon]|nr:helix-turn-helix domain-containing protein [Candidatus Aenigmarchaeota archaeon]
MELLEIINGTLLSDASIRVWKSKYYYYTLNAKDKNFLKWVNKKFRKFRISTYLVLNNTLSKVYSLGFYMNLYPELINLKEKWYKKENGKTFKTIPRDLKITPTTLLFWYLGDGCLIRRKDDSNRVPSIVLATNNFSKEDIDFLIKKLKETDLTFYPVKYKSGFTGKNCGYCLYSVTQDGTPFRFFKLIGLECPKEIAECSTGNKGIYKKEKFFKDKWPTEEDWIRILSNVKVGVILRERRLELKLSQKQLAKKLGVSREHLRDVELGKRCFSVKMFRKILKVLGLNIKSLLKEIVKNDERYTEIDLN